MNLMDNYVATCNVGHLKFTLLLAYLFYKLT